MSIIHAILYGVIQGITEFLPISSMSYLHFLYTRLENVTQDTVLVFEILVHLGTVLTIFIMFGKDIFHLLMESVRLFFDCLLRISTAIPELLGIYKKPKKKTSKYRKLLGLLLFGTLPTVVIGYFFLDIISIFSQDSIITGIFTVLNGVILLIAAKIETGNIQLKDATYTQVFLIGLAQAISLLPGISRFAVVLTAALLLGFDKKFALRFTILLSLPAVLGAALYQLKPIIACVNGQISMQSLSCILLVAAICGVFSIKLIAVLLKKQSFRFLGIYSIITGILIASMM